MSELTATELAFLDTISGTESAGRYNVMYGGDRFSSYADHPRQYRTIKSGPNKGRASSAAGRYQFLGSTWDEVSNQLGLSDFSPRSQDKGALHLAKTAYRDATNRDLIRDLQSGDPARISQIGRSLAGKWTSLPGGIEQGIGSQAFSNAFLKNLAARSGGGPATAPIVNAHKSLGPTANEQSFVATQGTYDATQAGLYDPTNPQFSTPDWEPEPVYKPHNFASAFMTFMFGDVIGNLFRGKEEPETTKFSDALFVPETQGEFTATPTEKPNQDDDTFSKLWV